MACFNVAALEQCYAYLVFSSLLCSVPAVTSSSTDCLVHSIMNHVLQTQEFTWRSFYLPILRAFPLDLTYLLLYNFGDLDEPIPGPIYYRIALSLVFLRFIDLLRSRASLAEPDSHTKRGRESGLKHIELFCAR